MLTSSSSFALIGHRTLELYYFIIIIILFYYYYYYFLFFIKYLALFTATIFPISTPTRTVRRSLPVSITSGSDHFRFRSLPVPNPHCSPTNRTDPRATLRPKPTSHCSPPSLPVSITYGSDHFRFPPRTLRRPVTDLGLNVSDNIRCDVINSYLLTLQIWGRTSATHILLTCYHDRQLWFNFGGHFDFSELPAIV